MLCEFIPEAGASLSERGAGAGRIQPGWVGSGSAAPVEMHGFAFYPDAPRASQGALCAVPRRATPCHAAVLSCAAQSHLPTPGSCTSSCGPFHPRSETPTPCSPSKGLGGLSASAPLPAALAEAPFLRAKTDRGWSPELQSGSPARPHSTAVM